VVLIFVLLSANRLRDRSSGWPAGDLARPPGLNDAGNVCDFRLACGESRVAWPLDRSAIIAFPHATLWRARTLLRFVPMSGSIAA